jgi:hypothetical protein
MPIIINEFEVVVEPPPREHSTPDEHRDAESQPPHPLRPEHIVEVMRVHYERMERVRAD